MSNYHCDSERDDRAAVTSGQVQAQAARSVALLTAIESTVNNLSSNASIFQTLADEAKRFAGRIEAYDGESLLDPEGRSCELLAKAAAAAERIYSDSLKRRQLARADAQLRDEDGVVDAYTAHLAAVADFHNALEDLRNLVSDVDALKSPRTGKVFKDVGQLLSAIGVDAAKD